MARYLAIGALVIALISLALNVVLISRLNTARAGAIQTLDRVSTRLQDLPDVSFQYTARVQQTFPVSGELPFKQDMFVPISATIPVSTTAHASINTLFGPIDTPVGVNTTVPIDLVVPVSFSRTVSYSLTVPIDLQVPISIRLRDLGIAPTVDEMQTEIRRLKSSLQ